MKKNKKLISTIFIILLVIVVFTLIIVTKLHKSIVGTWISDGGTIYEFQAGQGTNYIYNLNLPIK